MALAFESISPEISVAVLGGITAAIKYFYDTHVKRVTINIAYLTEVARLLEVLERHLRWWTGQVQNGGVDRPLIPFSTPVYDSHIDELGILDQRYAAHVIGFYGYLKFLNAMQAAQQQYGALNQMAEFGQVYKNALEGINGTYQNKFVKAFADYKIEWPAVRST